MALQNAFFLVAVVLTLASGFHVYPKGDPLEKSLAQQELGNTKVVAGQNATQGQFPYQIQMFYREAGFSHFICGGSLISYTYVLTAAHCVHEYESDPTNILLTAGELDVNVDSGLEQVLTASRVIKHEGYNPENTEHDIALVQASSKFTFNANVAPICVPPAGWRACGNGIISGWGRTNPAEHETATILQYATLSIISDSACQDVFNSDYVRENDICGGPGPQGQGGCHGDSGGPFVVRNRVAGIVSRGKIGCDSVSIFTETAYYTDWIAQNSGVGSC